MVADAYARHLLLNTFFRFCGANMKMEKIKHFKQSNSKM